MTIYTDRVLKSFNNLHNDFRKIYAKNAIKFTNIKKNKQTLKTIKWFCSPPTKQLEKMAEKKR